MPGSILHLQHVALPFDLASVLRIFTKIHENSSGSGGKPTSPGCGNSPVSARFPHLGTITDDGTFSGHSNLSRVYPFSGVPGGLLQATLTTPGEKVLHIQEEVLQLQPLDLVSCRHIMSILGHLIAAIIAVMWTQFRARGLQS